MKMEPFGNVTAAQLKAELEALPPTDSRSPNFVNADAMTNRDVWALADDQYSDVPDLADADSY